jgi:Flp pilus assembly pilin Flp
VSAPRAALRFVREQRGAVMVEYALVLTLVALGLIAALVTAGALLFRLFCFQEAVLIAPYP